MSIIGLAYHDFLKTLPTYVQPLLQLPLPQLTVRQPYRWLVQWYERDPNVHYEVQRVRQGGPFELGLHFESRHSQLNDHLLTGFLQRLIEVQATLGPGVVAEPWDRGWSKVYLLLPAPEPLTVAYQREVATALVAMVGCLHPLLQDIYMLPVARPAVARPPARREEEE